MRVYSSDKLILSAQLISSPDNEASTAFPIDIPGLEYEAEDPMNKAFGTFYGVDCLIFFEDHWHPKMKGDFFKFQSPIPDLMLIIYPSDSTGLEEKIDSSERYIYVGKETR